MSALNNKFPTIKFYIKTKGDYVTRNDDSINYIKNTFYLLPTIDLSANVDLLEEFSGVRKLSANNIITIFTSSNNVTELLKLKSEQLDKAIKEKTRLNTENIENLRKYSAYEKQLKTREEELVKNNTTLQDYDKKRINLEIQHLTILLDQLNEDINEVDDDKNKIEAKINLINTKNSIRLSRTKIIDNNIHFLKDNLFKINNIFNTNNKKYIITSSEFNPINKLFKLKNSTNINYYTYDKYVIENNDYTLENEVKQQTTYIVFINLTLYDYVKLKYKQALNLKKNNINIDNKKYNLSNFITLKCEDKAFLLEEQASSLDFSFNMYSFFNNTQANNDIQANNSNSNNDAKSLIDNYFVKDSVILKYYPMKSQRQLKYEEDIATNKVDDYNEEHEEEITNQSVKNRIQEEAQRKKDREAKRRESEQYIRNTGYNRYGYGNPQYNNPQYNNPQYNNPQYSNPLYSNINPFGYNTGGKSMVEKNNRRVKKNNREVKKNNRSTLKKLYRTKKTRRHKRN